MELTCKLDLKGGKLKMTDLKVTGPMEVSFMATTKAVKNDYTGKMEFKIRGYLDSSDPAIAHLRSVNEDIVDTKRNMKAEDQSKKLITFTSGFTPTGKNLSGEYILDKEGNVLDEASAFINTKYDKATVKVVYKEHAKRGVNLVGFQILSLEKGERPESEEGTKSISELDKILQSGV